MWYWNQENFESLAAIAEALKGDSRLGMIATYCELRSQGLRGQSLREVRRFVEMAGNWPADVREETADRFLTIWHNHPEAHQLLTHPLLEGFIRPTLESWLSQKPLDPVGLRWLGLINNDEVILERALTLAPADLSVRRRLIKIALSDVDYATHHLVEDLFLGELADAEASLRRAQTLINDLEDPEPVADFERHHDYLRQLLDDWRTFSAAPAGSFRDFCAARGRKNNWWRIVYYGGEESHVSSRDDKDD